MSERDAFLRAVTDQAESMGLDFLGGALSGGVMAGGSIAINSAVEAGISNRQAEQILESPAMLDVLEETAGLELTEDMSKAQKRAAVKRAMAALAGEPSSTPAGGQEQAQVPVQTQPVSTDGAPELFQGREIGLDEFGPSGRKALTALYEREQDTAGYYGGFATWYQAGVRGTPMEQVEGPYAAGVNAAQRYGAYEAGRNDTEASLAEQKRAAEFAPVAGKDAGLVYDSYVRENVDNRTFRRVNEVAKALGVRVRFADSADGAFSNGNIQGSEILLEKGMTDPVLQVVGHEWTHRMQDLAPEQYRAFRDAVAGELVRETQKQIELHHRYGMEISYDRAVDEAVADHAGKLLADGKLLDRFIEAHRTERSLLEKVRDALRAVIRKLTGAEKRQVQTAEGKLTAALEAAAKQAERLTAQENKNAAQAGGEVRYSLGYDPETASVKEQIANSQETLSGMAAVVTVRVPEHFTKKSDAVKWATELLAKTGYAVERQGYGKITFSPKDINHAMNYADTDAEMAAIAALPSVLKRGVEIGRHNDHKGRKKATVTFAAPVVLNGTRGNMAVVVNQNGDHYYAHRIVMPDGSAFIFTTEKSNVAQEPSRGVAVSSSLADTTSATSENSIPKDGRNVKRRFSLKEFQDGVRFVDVETDQARFDGLSAADMRHTAVRIIKEKFVGKVIGLDNTAYVNSRTATEYGHPVKRISGTIYEAKMRASTELDNLLDAGTNFRTAPDGQDGHTHPDMTGDFRYFDTIFKVGEEYYSGVINIMPTAHGLVLKDITKIRNITQDICGSYGDKPQAAFLRDTSMDSISETDGESNRKFSLKGGELAEDMAALRRENARLQAQVERWKAQTQLSGGPALRTEDVTRLAGRLIERYSSTLKARDIAGELNELWKLMNEPTAGYREVKAAAEPIAQRL